jgi:beta-glucosidase
MTPAEEVAVIEQATDPDDHGEAGYLAGVPRLGIPAIRHADALGINVYADATAFPTRLGLASSFDRNAYNMLGEEVGKQGKALGVDLVYGPQVDMARYPSWSRNLTTNGEDAYVSSQFSAAEINGIQSTGLMSQVKHVSFYNGQNQSTPSLISSQAAHEVYLAPAQSAIEQGGVSSLMCSYAIFQIVGEQNAPQYACSNSNLLNNIVKNQFNLKGFITSDYTASKATSDILAGMDNEFATSNLSASKLVPLIDLTSSSFDPAYATATANAVARMVYEYERFGLLDNSKIPDADKSAVPQHGDVSSTYNGTSVDKVSGDKVALSLAEESGVLLKNDSAALPLSKDKTIAVVGPTSTLLPASPGGERSRGYGDQVNYTPLKAIKAEVGSANVTSAPGVDWIGDTVPTANLQTTDDASAVPGLIRTNTDGSTTVDTTIDGKQTTLAKGGQYTWTGYLNVTTADTYRLLLQRPYGVDTGNKNAYNGGVRQEAGRPAPPEPLSLSVDGAAQTIVNPGGNILQNAFPDGERASNGQYLGKTNLGVSLDLSVGLHKISFTYKPTTTTATTPTVRFAWAPLAQNTAKSVAAAKTSDETVIFVDDSTPGTTEGAGPNSSTSAALRNLNATQVNLINTVSAAAHAAGHKAVVVLNSGTAVSMPWVSNVDAVLEMWYPGEKGGEATTRLLYGDVNPSGKLPMTFPKDDNSTPFSGYPERTTGTQTGSETTPSIKWTDGVDVGYRWYTDPKANVNGYKPLFPFGYGLSYTSFDYSGLSVKNAKDGGLDVTFTVKNTGTKDGADSPQVYLGASPDLAAPTLDANGIVTAGFQQSAQKLVQFDHIQLTAGQSKTETLHVDVQQVSAWDTAAQKWVIGTGNRTISLGASSEKLVASVTRNIPETVTAPTVTSNPAANTTVTEGSTVTLHAAATGSPAPTVQWQKSTDKGTTWNDITGATATSYSFTAQLADNGTQYRAVFTNDLGSVPTSAEIVTVKAAPLSAPSHLTVTPSVKVGSTTYVKSKVTLSWTGSAPATSVKSYQVRDGSKVVTTVPATALSAPLTLTAGKHSLTVVAVANNASIPGGNRSSVALAVTVDKTAPTVKVTTPRHPHQASSWSNITGTAKDSGSGVASVTVKVTEKRGSSYYYFTGSSFVKASSSSSALSKAAVVTATVKSDTWTAPLKGLRAGTLIIHPAAADKLGNLAASAEVKVTIK